MTRLNKVVSVAVAGCFLLGTPGSVQAEEREPAKGSSFSQVVVNAPPEEVYKAIIKLRDQSKDSVKELSREGQHACILEETFDNLPIIGDAKCVYKEVYVPYKMIEYYMVRSEKFRAFEGRWQIAPAGSGEATNLSLSSYVDLAIPVPFAKQLTKMQTMKGVKKRLKEVKTICESPSHSVK